MSESRSKTAKRTLLDSIVCPHCWTTFPLEDALWIAESPALHGDMKLGEMERERFLPTEYDAQGFAVDAKGFPCREQACPHCHLPIPSAAFEAPTIFMSIVGAPASGKSYYLASSTWFLRKIFPKKFSLEFTDADPRMNQRLQEYETQQFLAEDDRLVKLEKTAEQGDLYNSVQFDDQVVTYPQPFIFRLAPGFEHPNRKKIERLTKTICLYDNAGESYLPTKNSDSASNPVTRHLGKSDCVLFLFDPTQDARFRDAIEKQCEGRKPVAATFDAQRRSLVRQESIFAEATIRIRAARRMRSTDRFDRPLIVVVTKLDEWKDLIPSNEFRKSPISGAIYQGQEYCYLRLDKIQMISARVRSLLMRYTPEFVSAVENFAEEVVYIPVSAMGKSPEIDAKTHNVGFRAKDVEPIWIETPMLYALSKITQGIIPAHEKPL